MTYGGSPDRRPSPAGRGDWPGNSPARAGSGGPANLADILERVLDKGIVIAGDIQINLVDVELLTIKIRLLVASVDRAREMGIDWWERDPTLSSKAADRALAEENESLRRRLARQSESTPAGIESADSALVEENRRLRELLAEDDRQGAPDDDAD